LALCFYFPYWTGAHGFYKPGAASAFVSRRSAQFFGNSPEFWMNLQTHYDLKMARQNLDAKDIKRIKAERAA
jgi:hypothetical protein